MPTVKSKEKPATLSLGDINGILEASNLFRGLFKHGNLSDLPSISSIQEQMPNLTADQRFAVTKSIAAIHRAADKLRNLEFKVSARQ